MKKTKILRFMLYKNEKKLMKYEVKLERWNEGLYQKPTL